MIQVQRDFEELPSTAFRPLRDSLNVSEFLAINTLSTSDISECFSLGNVTLFNLPRTEDIILSSYLLYVIKLFCLWRICRLLIFASLDHYDVQIDTVLYMFVYRFAFMVVLNTDLTKKVPQGSSKSQNSGII